MADANEIVVASRAADNFVPTFYKVYDRQRHLLHQMYKDSSAVLWNGNPLVGQQNASDFFLKLPATDHVVHSYDSQPVMGAYCKLLGATCLFLFIVNTLAIIHD
ncbi:hypothetical protein SpCBS45565_g03589 [Spizellomyces sp. 'palustris']|nr:hypothetical protein SpCBS45565_g03589 [Spizellomyces sp. 'palustris']